MEVGLRLCDASISPAEEEEAFASLIAVLEKGISMTRNGKPRTTLICTSPKDERIADPVGDRALRLEKYLADLVSRPLQI